VKVGDLVRITHGPSNIPTGTLALIVVAPSDRRWSAGLFKLKLMGHGISRLVRFRADSLEVVSEGR
jgi:hypothetical protein